MSNTRILKFTYNKKEKLKSKTLIDKLFSEGQSVTAFPLRLVYVPTDFKTNSIAKTGVSVSKKHFKKAVDRNRIKRLLREAYRLHKAAYFNNLTTPHAFMILYISQDMPTYKHIETQMHRLFKKFLNKVS